MLASYEYYTNTYLGEPIKQADYPRFEKRAEDLILTLINRTAEQVAAIDAATHTAVLNSICAQIEYLQEYGVGVATYGKEAGGGFTVGKVTVNNGGSEVAAGTRSMIAPAVYMYLERTGLLNPAVDTAPEPWPATRGWW